MQYVEEDPLRGELIKHKLNFFFAQFAPYNKTTLFFLYLSELVKHPGNTGPAPAGR